MKTIFWLFMMIASLILGVYLARDSMPLGIIHPMFTLPVVIALGASLAMTVSFIISPRNRANAPGALCILCSLAAGAYVSSMF